MSEDTTKVVRSSGGKFARGTGKPAGSGRKKGTPNKRTEEFIKCLGNFDTVAKLKKLYEETEKEDLKFQICKEFLKYQFPQRKAVDIEGDAIELPVINIQGI